MAPPPTRRPRVSVYIAISLDGCIARADGSLDWLDPMQQAGEDYGYAGFMAGIDTLIVGRNTYDVVRGFAEWPFAGKRVVVLTHRPLIARHGETAHAGALAPMLADLQAAGVRHVYLDGGQAIRQGLAERCVDAITLSVAPTVLGAGRPLFGADVPASDWTLVATRAFDSGLVQLRYATRR
jgi:dihydrofolate reductase